MRIQTIANNMISDMPVTYICVNTNNCHKQYCVSGNDNSARNHA